jgi:hypothetical protein
VSSSVVGLKRIAVKRFTYIFVNLFISSISTVIEISLLMKILSDLGQKKGCRGVGCKGVGETPLKIKELVSFFLWG